MALVFEEIECRKHGVLLDEIEDVLRARPLIVEDPIHSSEEPRFRAIGRNAGGRSIFIVFTVLRRGDRLLARPISARYMHSKEVRSYEQDQA